VPIFGVRGANSGIDDADNAAWKLAYVIKGLAGEALLDSYSSERVAAAHENLSYGTKSTEFMAPPSFAFALMRTAVLSLAAQHPAVRSLINPRQSSPIAYTASPLNSPQDEAWSAGPAPGAVLPECPLAVVRDGVEQVLHMTDLLGPGFTVFQFGGDPAQIFDGVTMVQLAPRRTLNARYFDHSGRLFAMYGAQEGAVYLVRPDGHLAGRWHAPSAATVRSAIDRVLHPMPG
jgi:3-(3-hydroxy-phenyl)propionate hydroxylase